MDGVMDSDSERSFHIRPLTLSVSDDRNVSYLVPLINSVLNGYKFLILWIAI